MSNKALEIIELLNKIAEREAKHINQKDSVIYVKEDNDSITIELTDKEISSYYYSIHS
jgi:hypothetical protein